MSIDINEIGKSLRDTLGTDVAIIDKYGFILHSSIEEFKVDTVISTTVLEFINGRAKVAKELKTNDIESIVLAISGDQYVFTFGKQLILMSKIGEKVDLGQYLPAIKRFLQMLDLSQTTTHFEEAKDLDISKEIDEIHDLLKERGKSRENKFEIFREIVKHISQLR